jgi:hypothetical protein
MKNHEWINWDARIVEARVSYRGSHMSCCGIGAVHGFQGDGEPDDYECENEYDDAYQYWEYIIDMYETPEEARKYIDPSMPEDIETAEDYAQHRVDKLLAKYENTSTLHEAVRDLARELNEWSQGMYQQIVFSGCVSEYVPRTDGAGTYNTPFHAGTLAAWIEKNNYGHLWSGPVSHNDNHASMVMAWIWVPPWVEDEEAECSTYADCEAAELEETIYD